MKREDRKQNSIKSYDIYVIDILSERIKERDLLTKVHERRLTRKKERKILQYFHLEQNNQNRQQLEKSTKQNNTSQRS